MDTKKCSKCGEVKDAVEFYASKNKKAGLHSWCKKCIKISSAKLHAKHIKEYKGPTLSVKTCGRCRQLLPAKEFSVDRLNKTGLRTWCKKCVREYCVTHSYGISTSQYESMLSAQGGVCAICGSPPQKKRLAVDHCHTSGKVRGLLCDKCNRGIGMFMDRPELLDKAAVYLIHTPATFQQSGSVGSLPLQTACPHP